MTDRDIMQQALEALESLKTYAETTEPGLNVGVPAITALRERLAQPEQEPVLWLNEEKKIIYWHNTHETDDYHGFKRTVPLYTATPQRKPLTDEEIRHFWREATMKPKYTSEFVKDFARAIEAAHGIKGEA